MIPANLLTLLPQSFRPWRVLPIGLFLGLAACGGADRTCMDSTQPYLSARNNPPLRIPDGMSAPNTSSALPIPSEDQVAGRPGDGCLADPPSYFRRARWRVRRKK
jgi:uncharacterized lipoprotein